MYDLLRCRVSRFSPDVLVDSATAIGSRVRVNLEQTAWRDGTTHLIMSPLEFIQRLAALIQPAATAPPTMTASRLSIPAIECPVWVLPLKTQENRVTDDRSQVPSASWPHLVFKQPLKHDVALRSADAHRLKVLEARARAIEVRATGELPAQERRVLRRQLLSDTAMPIIAIAQSLHFADASVFTRAFRRRSGMTPTQWRASSRPNS